MDFAENLNSIQQRIAAACGRAGRDTSSVTLLAVSKTHPPETVQALVDRPGCFTSGISRRIH